MTEKLNRLGVVLGRFQPFHFGHQHLIQTALDECKEVLVLVGRPSVWYATRDNPITPYTRVRLIRMAFPPSSFHILAIADEPTLTLWFDSLTETVQAMNYTYRDTPPLIYSYREDEAGRNWPAGTEIRHVKSEFPHLSGTKIREHFYNTGLLQNVPDVTHQYGYYDMYEFREQLTNG
jgi:cytidyltransferase-like protein